MISGPELKSYINNISDENCESYVFIKLFSLSMIEDAILRLRNSGKEKESDIAFSYLAKIRQEGGLKDIKEVALDAFNGVGQIDTFERALEKCYDNLVLDLIDEANNESSSNN